MKCLKCQKYSLEFDRRYKPSDFLEGKRNSLVWIIGINPKPSSKGQDARDIRDLESRFDGKVHPYFKDFSKVSKQLYDLLGKNGGAAHTDIVKCSSAEFPPKNCTRQDVEAIIENCAGYLEEQLKRWSPKVVICNGSPVCRVVTKIIKPPSSYATSYVGKLDNEMAVVLSGFIGRIDDYAKARLGKEVDSYLERYRIV